MDALWFPSRFGLMAVVGLVQKLSSEFLWAVTCRRSNEMFIAGAFRLQICKALDHIDHCNKALGKLQVTPPHLQTPVITFWASLGETTVIAYT